jgi:hypothetical protein
MFYGNPIFIMLSLIYNSYYKISGIVPYYLGYNAYIFIGSDRVMLKYSKVSTQCIINCDANLVGSLVLREIYSISK